MNRLKLILLCIVIVAACCQSSRAQSDDLIVGDIEMPSLHWGKQQFTLEVTNNADYLRYLAITFNIRFEGTYLNPSRLQRRHVTIEPGRTRKLATTIDIPGNFGAAYIDIGVYDVIDTLDALLASQKILTKGSMVQYNPPAEVLPYLQQRTTLPPMVDNNISFDTEFSRLLTLLLSEGKSIVEIARITSSDSAFVQSTLDSLVRLAYFKRGADGRQRPVFPVIREAAAQAGRTLADSVASELAALYQINVRNHRAVLDSMIAAGSLPKDSLDFLNGGSVLFLRYPFITAMSLWGSLGQRFVTDATPMTVFANTDPCNAYTIPYMYLVEGGAVVNGEQYFRLEYEPNRYSLEFADTIPAVECPDKMQLSRSLGSATSWRYKPPVSPEAFLFSASLSAPVLRLFDSGTSPILQRARERLDQLAAEHSIESPKHGLRYWFWNLVATKTTNKLVASSTIQRYGNGFYRLISK